MLFLRTEPVLSRPVKFEYDSGRRTDRYGRTLAYVWVLDGYGRRLYRVNDRLVADGYANIYSGVPFEYSDEYLEYEREAREEGRGLWGRGKAYRSENTQCLRKIPMRHAVVVWIVLFVAEWITLGVQQANAQGSVGSDHAALVALYDATDGDNWHDNTNWKSDKPLGEWYGVTTNEEERVDSLLFRNNNLTGRIPIEISTLDNLEMLHFGDNTLFGNIPSEIGKLKNIKDIRLYNNSLYGPIPLEIGELDSLSVLLLDGKGIIWLT